MSLTATLQLASLLQSRLDEIRQFIATNSDNLSWDDSSINWSYDEKTNEIDLTISSFSYENTACTCHPEYELTRERFDISIPVLEIISEDSEADDYFDVSELPFAKKYLEDRAAAKEAKKLADAEAARARIAERERQQRAADEAELRRLQTKLGM